MSLKFIDLMTIYSFSRKTLIGTNFKALASYQRIGSSILDC